MVAPPRPRFYTFETADSKPPILRGRSTIYLQALAAPRMPQILAICEPPFFAPGLSGPSLLQSVPNSLDIGTAAADTTRIFELRVYQSGPAIDILHRSNIHPILYSPTTYLIPFDSLAAREKAWTAFSADPEWIESRQSNRVHNISLWKAANIGITPPVF